MTDRDQSSVTVYPDGRTRQRLVQVRLTTEEYAMLKSAAEANFRSVGAEAAYHLMWLLKSGNIA